MSQTYGWWNVKNASIESEIPVPAKYHNINFFTKIPSDREINRLREKYMIDKLLESSKRGGVPFKDVQVDQEGLANKLASLFYNWENFFELVEITEDEWQELDDEFKFPEIYPRRTMVFYKKEILKDFKREKVKELIFQDMMFFIIGVFFNKAALYEAIEEEIQESELKNSASTLLPSS